MLGLRLLLTLSAILKQCIRDILGHVDVSTTEIYARADTEMKRKAIEASCKDILPDENFQDWNENINIMSFLNSLC